MAALAFDWTLEDLERFCTDPEEYVVLSVDPHLEFGQFSRYRDHIPAHNAGIQASETRKQAGYVWANVYPSAKNLCYL